MARVKRGSTARKRHKKVLNRAKGFRGALHRLFRQARPAVFRAMVYQYRDRKNKKRDFRRLWIARINAALRAQGVTYSKFINQCKQKDVTINRKSLAQLAVNQPEVFNDIVSFVK